jgi:hypothetical protein
MLPALSVKLCTGRWRAVAVVQAQNMFESCCKKRTVVLDPLSTPLLLCDIFSSNSSPAKHFQANIRHFNAALSHMFFTYTADRRLRPRKKRTCSSSKAPSTTGKGLSVEPNPHTASFVSWTPRRRQNLSREQPSLVLD